MIRSVTQRSESSGDDSRELRDALEDAQTAKKLAETARDASERARQAAETERDEVIRREHALKVEFDELRARVKVVGRANPSLAVASAGSREQLLVTELSALKKQLVDADKKMKRLEKRVAGLRRQLSSRRWFSLERASEFAIDSIHWALVVLAALIATYVLRYRV